MKILFVSRGDGCRSAIAVGLAKQVFGPQAKIDSAGVSVRSLHPAAVAAMREINIDITGHTPTELDLTQVAAYDLIVVVEPRNPFSGTSLKTHFLHWPLPDPLDPPVNEQEIVTRIRDTRIALSKHVKALGKQVEMRLRG